MIEHLLIIGFVLFVSVGLIALREIYSALREALEEMWGLRPMHIEKQKNEEKAKRGGGEIVYIEFPEERTHEALSTREAEL